MRAVGVDAPHTEPFGRFRKMQESTLERMVHTSRIVKGSEAAVQQALKLQIGARRVPRGANRRSRRSLGLGGQEGGNNGGGSCVPVPWQGDPGSVVPVGAPVYGRCPEQFNCDCDLVASQTLGAAAPLNAGIAAGATANVLVDNFDAVALQPVAVWFTAFTRDGNNTIANPVVEVPVQINDVTIGGTSQLRTRGIANALNSAAFAATREPVCVDWAEFRSIPGMQLQFEVQNIVVGTTIHFTALLWCNILQ